MFNKIALLEQEEIEEGRYSCRFISEQYQPVYMSLPQGDYRISITINGVSEEVENSGYMDVFYLGTYQPGEEICLEIEADDEQITVLPELYSEDLEMLGQYCKVLRQRGVYLDEITSSRLVGTVFSEQDEQYIVSTIPFDEGWKIEIDGKRIEILKNWDTMLAFKVDKGEHDVVMQFRPRGFVLGCVISSASLVLAIIYMGYNYCSLHVNLSEKSGRVFGN